MYGNPNNYIVCLYVLESSLCPSFGIMGLLDVLYRLVLYSDMKLHDVG
jgi:hypothetical protein